MLTINESMLKQLSALDFPFVAKAKQQESGYVLYVTCEHMHVKDQPLNTARGEVRVFKTFENLKKVCNSFGVNKITVL